MGSSQRLCPTSLGFLSTRAVVGAPPILVYFSGDWDVHCGYRILTHGQLLSVNQGCEDFRPVLDFETFCSSALQDCSKFRKDASSAPIVGAERRVWCRVGVCSARGREGSKPKTRGPLGRVVPGRLGLLSTRRLLPILACQLGSTSSGSSASTPQTPPPIKAGLNHLATLLEQYCIHFGINHLYTLLQQH